ncbi:MAG: serine hydrolase [Candidatus Sungbacteria bacterium]|nr:serine hydrolase [Candidatus Sungbacteria bacterium]
MFFSEDIKRIFIKLAAVVGIAFVAALILNLAPTMPSERFRQGSEVAVLEKVGEEQFPRVSAEAVLVRRMKTGETLFAKNESSVFAVASIVKIVTALLFAERISPLTPVSFPGEIAGYLEPDEKRSAILPNEKLKAEDLLKLIIAESDNDAAYVAADAVSVRARPELIAASFPERIAEFVFLMNERGRTLGLSGTNFTNPAGRDDLLNFSTANDLFVIVREIYTKAPNLWNVSRIVEGDVYSASGRRYHFENTNKLLKEFPAIFGSKTGFTDNAGEALLMLYELAPQDPIAVIILKSGNRFGDGRAILGWLDKNYRITRRENARK